MPKDFPLTNKLPIPLELIERRIYFIRGQKVMLDSDLAELYQVPTKRLNEAMGRNRDRFPEDFMFQLTAEEANVLRSQFATSNLTFQFVISKPAGRGGRRYLPYAFTEHGVAMLSSVLNSTRAVQMNIYIIRTFIKLRRFLADHKELVNKIEKLERIQKEQGIVLSLVIGDIKGLDKKMAKEFEKFKIHHKSKSKIGFRTS